MWQDLYDEYDLCEPVRKAPRKRKVDASTAADPAAPCPAAAPCAAAAAPSASLPAAPAAVAVAVAAPHVQAVAVPVCSAGSAPMALQHSGVGAAPMVTANGATMPAATGHCSVGVTEIVGVLPAAAAAGVASQAANGRVAGMAGAYTQGSALSPMAAHGAVCGAAASVAAGGDGRVTALATAPAARAAPTANGHTRLHMPALQAQAAPVLAAAAAPSLASAPDAATLAGVAALFGASIGGTALARPPPGGNPALGQVNSALVQGLPAATPLAARAGDTAVAAGAFGAVPEGCPGAVQPPAPKRRGRPPGSGKKQKAEGQGGPAKPRAPRAPRDPGQNLNAGDIAAVAVVPADAAAAGAAGTSPGENPSTANGTSGRPARRAASFSVNYAAAGGEPGMERVMYDDGFDRLLGCTKCRYLKNGCGTVSHPTWLGACLASDARWSEIGPLHLTVFVSSMCSLKGTHSV